MGDTYNYGNVSSVFLELGNSENAIISGYSLTDEGI